MIHKYKLITKENGLKYYTSPLFEKHGIPHCFTTRHGGVSTGCFDNLNFAQGSGAVRDTWENVFKNYEIIASLFGLGSADVCRTNQTHSDVVAIAEADDRGRGMIKEPYAKGVDGLATAEQGLLLSVRSADCVPVLFYDIKNNITAAVHSGWRGTRSGIISKAADKMKSLGADMENVYAAVGPFIKKCCYEVGVEFLDVFNEYPRAFDKNDDRLMFDMTVVIEAQLASAGIPVSNISVSDTCNCCDDDFFSHRRSGPERGTMSAFIKIKD